jgi:hypothetical protein
MTIAQAVANVCETQLAVYRIDGDRLTRDANSAIETAQDHLGRCLYELIQNCDDAGAGKIQITVSDNAIYVADNGRGLAFPIWARRCHLPYLLIQTPISMRIFFAAQIIRNEFENWKAVMFRESTLKMSSSNITGKLGPRQLRPINWRRFKLQAPPPHIRFIRGNPQTARGWIRSSENAR